MKEHGLVSSNVRIDPKKAYVLFVGPDEKYVSVTRHLIGMLSARYGKPVEIINILPNIPSPDVRSFIVLNHMLYEHIAMANSSKFYFASDAETLNRNASNSPHVTALIEQILESQPDLFVNVYKNTSEMTLHKQKRGVKIIGPRAELVEYFDDKLNQRRIAEDLGIPVPKGYIAHSFEELIRLYKEHFQGDAFVSCSHGTEGFGSEKVSSLDDIFNSDKLNGKRHFVLSELLDLESSPSCQGIVANGEEVAVVGVGDQIMEGVNYRGNMYPSEAGEQKVRQMREHTMKIGRYMGEKGYRGFFSVDFMFDENKLYFSEVNPRKTGPTPELILANKISNPDVLSLAELEYLAIIEGTFGKHRLAFDMGDIYFGLRVVKAKEGQRTVNYVPMDIAEADIFRKSGNTILDHPGEVFYLNEGKVVRVVCVDRHNQKYDPRKNILVRLEQEADKIKVA